MIKSFRTKYFSIVLLTFKPYTMEAKGFFISKWLSGFTLNYKSNYRWLSVGFQWDKNSGFRLQDQPQPEPESEEDEMYCGKCDDWVPYTSPEFAEYRCDVCGARIIY